jgi:hypothetical protein
VAEAAAALHMPPAVLLETDSEVLEYLWPLAERARKEDLWAKEMLAVAVEMTHAVWRVLIQVNTKKGTLAPRPLKVPRPWSLDQGDADRRPRISWGQLIKRIGRRG